MWQKFVFPHIIECDKHQGSIYKGPQAVLTSILEYIRAFFRTYEIVGKRKFRRKGNLSSDEKILTYFSSFYRTWHMSGNKISGSTMYFDKYCANDKIISLGPKRSIETNITKISCSQDDKKLCPVFPRTIEWDKHQKTNYEGPKAILTFTLELVRAFFRI